MRLTKSLTAAGGIAVAVALLLGTGAAPVTADSGTVLFCQSPGSGALKIVTSPNQCNGQVFTVNEQGPVGPAGPRGATGATGVDSVLRMTHLTAVRLTHPPV